MSVRRSGTLMGCAVKAADFRMEGAAGGSNPPAIQARLSRFRGTIQRSLVRRQETQIVQSQLTLRDLLP